MPNVTDSIEYAIETLDRSGISQPKKEANSLLSYALQKDGSFLIAHNDYNLTESEWRKFQSFVIRRCKREPFQHITGKQEFWGLDFVVSPDVMIPRPETEMIVEQAVKILQAIDSPKFCEIGIGSGCITVSILHFVEKAKAVGVDISEKAVDVAKLNASTHNVLDRLDINTSNVFENFDETEKFDLIVTNPPYVPSEVVSGLQKEVRDFDPHIALTDGKDGLSIIRKIIDDSPKHLKPNRHLLMEIGFNQSEKVREMFDLSIWEDLQFLPDLQGIPRMVMVRLI